MNAAARRLADAIREGAARDAERRGPGRHRATVLSVTPVRLDVHGSDIELDGEDVTFGRSVADAQIGDVLVLIEVDDDEYIAVDMEPRPPEEPSA